MLRYIDVDELIDILYDAEYTNSCPLDEVSTIICDAPTADVQPVVHGAWKEVYDINSQDYNSDNNWWLRCSCCQNHTKISFRKQRFGYCPNCGAKMDGGESNAM